MCKLYRYHKLIIFICVAYFATGCKSDGDCDFKLSQNHSKKMMSFSIQFENDAKDTKIDVAKLKYNKKAWISLEWDDNSLASLAGYKYLHKKFYTDGCNNKIPYTAALAVNGRGQRLNKEMAERSQSVNYADMKMLINAGWDIENHSYYHEPKGIFNNGYNWDKNISDLHCLIYNRINYTMNGAVVPTNYYCFATAALNFGYLFSSSQTTFDNMAPGPASLYQPVQNFDAAPATFSSFSRIFNDDWAKMEVEVKQAADKLLVKNNSYFRFASHTIDDKKFEKIINYISYKAEDNVLFIPTREIMEYRIVASLPIKYVVRKNEVIVNIDASNLPEKFRWRDLSFVIKSNNRIIGTKIIKGIDKITFNSKTGLLNIFSQNIFN